MFCIPAPPGAGCKTRLESRIKKLNPILFLFGFAGQASGSTKYEMDCGIATPKDGPANQTECMAEFCLFNVTAGE